MARNGERDFASSHSMLGDQYFHCSQENHKITHDQIEKHGKDAVKKRNGRQQTLFSAGFNQITEKAVHSQATSLLFEHNSLHSSLEGIDILIKAYTEAKREKTLTPKSKLMKDPNKEKVALRKALLANRNKLPDGLKGELVDHT